MKCTNKAAKLSAVFAAATALAMAVPAYAFADEGGGIEAILPKMNEFIPMLVAFIILWIILAKFGWPIFDGMLVKRENTINEALKKYAKAQAAKVIADAKETGEAVRADITKQAQDEATAMIEKARIAIEAEKKAAISDLQGSIADISVDVASRLISSDLSDAEHRAIIERYINEAGSFHAN